MKFNTRDDLINQKHERLEIVDKCEAAQEYAICNCVGRKVWFSASSIEQEFRLSREVEVLNQYGGVNFNWK